MNSEIIADTAMIPPAARYECSLFSHCKVKSAYVNINIFFTKRSIQRHTDKAAKSHRFSLKALLILKRDRSDGSLFLPPLFFIKRGGRIKQPGREIP